MQGIHCLFVDLYGVLHKSPGFTHEGIDIAWSGIFINNGRSVPLSVQRKTKTSLGILKHWHMYSVIAVKQKHYEKLRI